jgi:hypothetical protein
MREYIGDCILGLFGTVATTIDSLGVRPAKGRVEYVTSRSRMRAASGL